MGDDEITPSLEAAYAVETPDENRRLYAEWASSYEETFVAAKAYRYHLHVADALVAHVRPAGPTLDVGCGTGVVGVALRERGVSEIDGVDISPEMLEQAAMKGVYRQLIEADLTIGMGVADDTYAAVASAGTFTHGHLPPEPIRELIRVTMPGGRCAIGVNAAHFEDLGFAAWLEAAVDEGLIGPYELTRRKVYEGSDPSTPDDMSDIVGFSVR